MQQKRQQTRPYPVVPMTTAATVQVQSLCIFFGLPSTASLSLSLSLSNTQRNTLTHSLTHTHALIAALDLQDWGEYFLMKEQLLISLSSQRLYRNPVGV